MKPDDFIGNTNGVNGREWPDGQTFGAYACLDVLPFLNGKPWNELALAFVSSLRPSRVRVVSGGAQCDAQMWRVTVWLQNDGSTIDHIEQEVGFNVLGKSGADLCAEIGLRG